MDGLRLIIVEGDTHEDDAPIPPALQRTGRVEQIINYDGLTTGANGLLLHRDTNAVLNPVPHSDTRILVRAFVNYADPPAPLDNTIENNAQTYFLVRFKPNETLALGDDLDANDDGIIETGNGSIWQTKIAEIVDAWGYHSEQADQVTGRIYAAQFGYPQQGNDVFTADLSYRFPNGKWINCDVLGSGSGPFSFDVNEITDERIVNGMNRFCVYDGQASPGNDNVFPKVTVSGTVSLENCPPNIPLTFELRPDDGLPTETRTVTPAANGSFTLTNVPIQNFTLWVKGSKWVASTGAMDATCGNTSGVIVPMLKGGDGTNDNVIDVNDLALIIQSFDFSTGDSGFLSAADYTCNGIVDVEDLDVLIRNFDLEGAP
jgi:hypothetical protein